MLNIKKKKIIIKKKKRGEGRECFVFVIFDKQDSIKLGKFMT